MELMTKCRFMYFIIGAFLLSACGSDTPQNRESFVCEPGRVTGSITASEWVRQTTAIDSYRYEAGVGEDRTLRLHLLNKDAKELGSVEVLQLFDEASGEPVGTMQGILTQPDGTSARLTTKGFRQPKGYGVDMRIEADAKMLSFRALFNDDPCQTQRAATEEDAPAQPPECVGNLPIDAALYSLPSCGIVKEAWEDAGLVPILSSLRYRVDIASPEKTPEIGGISHSSTGSQAFFDVLERGVLADSAQVEQWAQAVGVDGLLGSSAERLLSAVFLDMPWQRELREHFDACHTEALENKSESLTCRALQLEQNVPLSTRRQAAGTTCGGPGSYNKDSWTDEDESSGASIDGDPHFTSFDGHAYDFQGAGEFIALEATLGDSLIVQTRFEALPKPDEPEACRHVTWTTAVATQLGERRLTFEAAREPMLYADGQPVDLRTQTLELPDGASISMSSPHSYRVIWPDGAMLHVNGDEDSINLKFDLPKIRRGQVRGLLGYFDDDPGDDFMTRSGKIIAQPADFDAFYEEFGESWRITQEESLFDYETGESTDTFTVPGFPAAEPDMSTIPAESLTAAEQTCGETGVKGQPFVDWCIIDVVCAQDNAAAEPFVEPTPSRSMRAEGFVVRDALKASRAPARLITAISGEGDDLYCSGAAEISIFKEKAGTKLDDAIELSVAAPGHYTQAGALIAETLAANTTVDSYYIYRGPSGHRLQGSVTFAAEILGVQVDDTLLKSSDGVLAADETDYGSETRGLDWEGASFELSDDGHTLEVDLRAGDGHQQIRILTEVY